MMTLPTLSAERVESDRLVLREAPEAGREDLEVRAHLGGARHREDVVGSNTALPGGVAALRSFRAS
jgi:hypothetical protein